MTDDIVQYHITVNIQNGAILKHKPLKLELAA